MQEGISPLLCVVLSLSLLLLHALSAQVWFDSLLLMKWILFALSLFLLISSCLDELEWTTRSLGVVGILQPYQARHGQDEGIMCIKTQERGLHAFVTTPVTHTPRVLGHETNNNRCSCQTSHSFGELVMHQGFG